MKRLLYVDDEETNLLLFEVSFANDFNIITAESGADALEMLKSAEFDIIVSDMKMPEMNGLEFILEVKKIKPDIPCYMLSGYSLDGEIDDAIENGLIIDFFQKPLNKKEFLNAVL